MTGALYDDAANAIELFSGNPSRCGKVIREALDSSPDLVIRVLVSMAEHASLNRGLRYTLILLRDRGLLVPALTDASVTGDAAASRIMEFMMSIDRNFVNVLLDGAVQEPVLRAHPRGDRLIRLIGDWAADITQWRGVTRLYELGDERLRSKCAVLLARYRFNEQGMLSRFGEEEPRVRANIVEALWDGDLSRTGALIDQALGDPNNRVAGNACLALYRAGDSRALGWLMDMLGRERIEFRVTAAWVMGQTGDPRFAPPLLEAANRDDIRLRETAIHAIASLDRLRPAGLTTDRRPWFISSTALGGSDEHWVRIVGSDGRFVKGVRAVDFMLSSGEQIIFDYTVEELPVAPSVSLRIAWPRSNDELAAVLAGSLRNKPPSQNWAVHSYDGNAPVPVGPAAFSPDPRALGAGFSSTAAGSGTLSQACQALLKPESNAVEQHLVLFSDDRSGRGIAADEIVQTCQARGIRFHCLPERPAAGLWAEFQSSLEARYVVKTRKDVSPASLTIRDASGGAAKYSGSVVLGDRGRVA